VLGSTAAGDQEAAAPAALRPGTVIVLPVPPKIEGGEFLDPAAFDPADLRGTPGDWQVMEGPRVVGGGDVDGDGRPDVLVANRHIRGDGRPDTVRAYSGADGRLLFDVVGGAGCGVDLDFAGDLDADGCDELVWCVYPVQVRQPLAQLTVCISSGRDGRLLRRCDSGLTGNMVDVVALDDVDADGTPDIGLTIDRDLVVLSGRSGERLVQFRWEPDASDVDSSEIAVAGLGCRVAGRRWTRSVGCNADMPVALA